MIAELKRLWQEAFGDSEETVNAFFDTGFSEARCNYIWENGIPASALYWFDCMLDGNKIAYIYAVATARASQGKGFAHALMESTHRILKEKGYAGAILVPGSQPLFDFYEKMGYRASTKVEEFSAVATNLPVSISEITPAEYATWRRKHLPKGGVLQEQETLSYLATYAKFYKGADFLFSATKAEDNLLVHEILGNTDCCGNILCALACKTGRFRTPGPGRNFAMFLPLQEDCPTPAYFGLALD